MVLDEFVCFDRVDIDIVYLSVCLSVCVFSLLSLSRCLLIYLFLPLWPRGDYARRKQMIRRTDCVY